MQVTNKKRHRIGMAGRPNGKDVVFVGQRGKFYFYDIYRVFD